MTLLNTIATDRLLLNPPSIDDAQAIFETYASSPAVTAYVGWRRHQSIDDTMKFIEFANAEWTHHSIGPYLIRDRKDGTLIGSTGISCTGVRQAMTGYVLAEESWGKGIATEVVHAMIVVAQKLDLHSLFALCHPAHRASCRVLEKTGFRLDSTWSETITFPNLVGRQSIVPVCYRQTFSRGQV